MVVALPQLFFLRLGDIAPQQPLFYGGGILDNPTVPKVIDYIGYMVGAKWPVIIVALILASWFQWRFFLALCSLFLLTFTRFEHQNIGRLQFCQYLDDHG